jgi:hypothetical protein
MSHEGLLDGIAQAVVDRALVVICGAGTSLAASGAHPHAGWSGLVEHALAWCEAHGVVFEGRDGLHRAREDLRAGDLISAADKAQRALEHAGQWSSFLIATFRSLPLRDPTLLLELAALGAPIATTNYDTLIEAALGGASSISWRSASFGLALRQRDVGIAHLHGVWTEPDTVIFGSGAYGGHGAVESVQALEVALGVRASMLFVGVGAGADDPNLGRLLRFVDDRFRDTGLTHYRLMTAEAAARVPPRSIVKPVVFGADPRRDLLPFVRRLVDRCGRPVRGPDRRAPVAQDLEELLAAPLLRRFDELGPTLRDLWPDLLVDVRVKSLRALEQRDMALSAWLRSDLVPRRMVVVGGPGAGKSTVLRQLVLREWDTVLPPREFFTAHELARAGAIDATSGSILVIDGLDELGDEALAHLSRLLAAVPDRRIWMSCRTDFFGRESPVKRLLDGVEQVFEVQPLTADDVDSFVAGYVARTGTTEAGEVLSRWRQTSAFADLLRVPLNLMLAVSLASGRRSGGGGQRGTPPTTRFELYREFYAHWLAYESDRASLRPADGRWLQERHTAIARAVYRRRQGFDQRAVSVSSLGTSARAGVLLSLLRTAQVAGRLVVDRFGHDTYMEYLLAAEVVDRLSGQRTGGLRLDVAFNDDVNAFIREAVSSLSAAERQVMLRRLSTLYETSSDPREREHTLYYIGRLDLGYCPEILVRAYRTDENARSRRAAALGAILHGEGAVEAEFLGQLDASDEEQLLNRSIQLVYFGDAFGDLHDFRDHGGPWTRNRTAVFERLGLDDRRSERLRWWDLLTLRSFFVSRDERPAEPERQVLRRVRDQHAGASERDRSIRSIVDGLLR